MRKWRCEKINKRKGKRYERQREKRVNDSVAQRVDGQFGNVQKVVASEETLAWIFFFIYYFYFYFKISPFLSSDKNLL